MHKLNFLTSLKGIAAWGIVLFHIKMSLFPYVPSMVYVLIDNSYLFVDLFFILSGFIISYNYLHSLSELNGVDIKRFYLKRLVRIYPLHFIMLLAYISIPLSYILFNKSYSTVLYNSYDFILNLLLIHNWGMGSHLTWNAPSWAVSVEIAAYLLFPFLASICAKFKSKASILSIILCCAIISAVYTVGGYKSIGTWSSIPKIGIVRGLLEFLIGMNIYLLYQKFSQVKNLKIIGGFLLSTGICGVIGVLYLNLSDIFFIPILITFLLISVLIFQTTLFKFLDNKILVHIGKISYSTYLIHYFLRDVFKLLFLEDKNTPIIWIASYGLSLLVFSHLSFTFIETPIAKIFKRKISDSLKERIPEGKVVCSRK